MHNSNLNNRSLHSARMKNFMQQGGQPEQQASPNDPMEQLVPAIKAAIEQGMPLAQLILTMAQNNIPMEVIQQGLAVAGIPEQEIMGAMNQLQQEQQEAQQQAPAEGPIQPTEGMPAEGQPKMPPVDQVQQGQPRMAQDGAEVDGDEIDYSAPIEELVTDYGDGYHYKKITDPSTGDMTYYTKSAKGKKWRDLQESGQEIPLKSTRAQVFGDKVEEWYGTEDEANFNQELTQKREAEIAAYKARKAQKEQEARNASDLKSSDNIPTYQQIIAPNSGYRTKVIKYNKGTQAGMPPGHIETILIDKDGNPVEKFMDNDGKTRDAFTNRWEQGGTRGKQLGYDKYGHDNRPETYFRSLEDYEEEIDGKKYKRKGLTRRLTEPGVQSMDITLDSKGLANFLNQSASSGSQDYHFADNNCADGVCRAYNVDDKNVGQTLGVEALGSLASIPSFLSGGRGALTDPDQVYEYLRKSMNISNETGKGLYKGRAQSIKDMISQAQLQKKIGRSGFTDAITPDAWVSPETAKLYDEALGYATDQSLKAVVDGTAKVYNTAKSAKNSLRDGLNSINAYLGGSPNWWKFQEGGQPGRYDNILGEAQYGMGIDNHLNFNQKFGQDDSFRSNINSAYMPMNLGMKGSNTNLLATVAEGAGRLFGAKDKDGDGLADGAFRDMKAKRNRHKDTMAVMKGKTPKGLMDNAGDKLMMKYDPETGNYQTAYNDPRYQSNVTKKKYGNIFKKGQKVNTGELVNKPFDYEGEGFKSFNQLKGDMSNLSQDEKDQLQYVADQRSAFETDKKDMPKGMQFGMDSKGGVGYYDKDATLPKDSQENLNKMMMQNKRYGGMFKAQNGKSIRDGGNLNQFGNTPEEQAVINERNLQKQTMFADEYKAYRDAIDAKASWDETDNDFGFGGKEYPGQSALDQARSTYDSLVIPEKRNGGSFNNPGFKALPKSVQQKIMTGIQKGQNGKEIMGEIMEAPEMNYVQGQEAIIRQYEDIIRRMQQQHAMEMQQLMMQMQQGQQESGASIGDMMNEADTMTVPPMQTGGGTQSVEIDGKVYNMSAPDNTFGNTTSRQMQMGGIMPPMQMGGGYGLPFAQDGNEVTPAIFDTQELKRGIVDASPSERMFLEDGLDTIEQNMLRQSGASVMSGGPNPGRSSSGLGPVPGTEGPPQPRITREERKEKRQEKRNLKEKDHKHGRTFRDPHQFTKVGKVLNRMNPYNWLDPQDRFIRGNPTRFWNLTSKKIKQDGGMIESQMQPNMQPMDPRMMEMQYMNDTAQQMMNPEAQAQMMQQMMSPQQLMQMQQYLEQLIQEIQEASPKGRSYKKPSPHDMDTVELSTEQIAKIMAAGGSVKIV